VSAPRSIPAESVADAPGVPDSLVAPLELVDSWAGGALALILGGSHASGSATWTTIEGRRICLSDLDVYAIVPDRARQRASVQRARADRGRLRSRLLDWGFAAPLEASFLLPDDLARLPARPGTIELARHGLVFGGDSSWRDRVPHWKPTEVSGEEIQLLLENRAFELLLAWPGLSAGEMLPRLLARHAVLKCALDVVRVEALARGEYPDGTSALVAWAARERDRAGRPAGLRTLLEAALAWHAGEVRALEPAAARLEWRAAVGAWSALWRARVGPAYADALRHARRARLRRRLRRALAWPDRSGLGPSLAERTRHALRGTPQHRVNAAAAVLLLAADDAPAEQTEPALPVAAARALATLGVVRGAGRLGWPAAARMAVRTWDLWVLDGQRTAESA
jgi:hypothetical protein